MASDRTKQGRTDGSEGAAEIHPTAFVEAGASLSAGVVIGPFAFVGAQVELGEDVEVGAHSTLIGQTRIGAQSRIFPHVCLGAEPQDQTFEGEATRLEVGMRTVIREFATIHVGTARGGACTRVGDDNFIMNNAHIGHDCQIGSHVIIAPFCGLGGHAEVDDFAVLGAYTGVHQHTRVGESVMAAGGSKLARDAPPFSMVAGDRARLVGLNSVGLRRRDFPVKTRSQIKRAFKILFQSKLLLEDALAEVEEEVGGVPEVERLVSFLRKTERGFVR